MKRLLLFFVMFFVSAGMVSAIAISPTSCADLKNLIENVHGCDKNFELQNSLDCSSDVGFLSICPSSYTGVFDGRNNTISNLNINQPGQNLVGLFGSTNGATIKNLGVVDANVVGNNVVGILVGSSYFSRIENTFTTGNVEGNTDVGGLIGTFYNAFSLKDSYSKATVEGVSNVGGLLGDSGYDFPGHFTILNCYATGDVNGSDTVGGLIGYMVHINPQNCFATGQVTGASNVGGLVGQQVFGAITNSFWDICRTGQNNCVGIGGSNVDCTPVNIPVTNPNDHYFYNQNNQPMLSWSYPPWDSVCHNQGYPTLEGLTDTCDKGPICTGQCGDGLLDSGEGCDDNNTEPGDGCDENCQEEPPQQTPEFGFGAIIAVLVIVAISLMIFKKRK